MPNECITEIRVIVSTTRMGNDYFPRHYHLSQLRYDLSDSPGLKPIVESVLKISPPDGSTMSSILGPN